MLQFGVCVPLAPPKTKTRSLRHQGSKPASMGPNKPATAYLSLDPLGKFRIRLVATRHKTVPVRPSIIAKLQVISESSIENISALPRRNTHHKPATTP